MFKDISNFTHTQDYLPIFTSVVITDLVVILLLNTNSLQ